MRALAIAVIGLGLAATAAQADIPTADAALLTERAQTSSTTLKLLPVKIDRKGANQGVNCAVTTGKKPNVADPTVKPPEGAGTRVIQPYAPDMSSTPSPNATGGQRSSQMLFRSTGEVVGGLDASRSTLEAAGTAFTTAGTLVGTAPTVMGALDVNSGARTANNLAWNGAIGSANLWVTALNALNLARAGDVSRAAGAMRSAANAALPATLSVAPACPTGSLGSGTAADPCRSASGACSAAGSTSACQLGVFVDEGGNSLVLLAPAGATSSANGQPLSLAAAITALSAQPSNP